MNIPKLKADLNELVIDLASFLHQKEIEQVQHFIHYNEVKLAVETLSDFLSENNAQLNQEMSGRINEFCRLLKIDQLYWIN